jgi:hypothetical protein
MRRPFSRQKREKPAELHPHSLHASEANLTVSTLRFSTGSRSRSLRTCSAWRSAKLKSRRTVAALATCCITMCVCSHSWRRGSNRQTRSSRVEPGRSNQRHATWPSSVPPPQPLPPYTHTNTHTHTQLSLGRYKQQLRLGPLRGGRI